MASENYAICRQTVTPNYLDFYVQESDNLDEGDESMTAIIDRDASGETFRIEIAFLQNTLSKIGANIPYAPLTSDTELALQVGTDNPISLILWMDKLYTKSHTHIATVARLLLNTSEEFMGLRVYTNQ